jgi:hypothetical protein
MQLGSLLLGGFPVFGLDGSALIPMSRKRGETWGTHNQNLETKENREERAYGSHLHLRIL